MREGQLGQNIYQTFRIAIQLTRRAVAPTKYPRRTQHRQYHSIVSKAEYGLYQNTILT